MSDCAVSGLFRTCWQNKLKIWFQYIYVCLTQQLQQRCSWNVSASRPDALQSAWGWDILDGKELGSTGAVMAKVVPKDSGVLPVLLWSVLSCWLINYLKRDDCRSWFESDKDKADTRRFTDDGFFSSACHFMHSYAFMMPAKGTVRIKFYFFIQTVAIDVLWVFFVCCCTSSELELEQLQWISFTTAGKRAFILAVWGFCQECMC